MARDEHQVEHAIEGFPDAPTITDADWPAYSAGYEAGLRAGIEITRLQIRVELVPVGPANAGIKLWRAMTHARLSQRAAYPGPALTGEQLRARARASWRRPPTSSAPHRRDTV